MQKEKIKKVTLWTVLVIIILTIISILMSVFKSAKKFKENVYNVTAIKLEKKKIPHILNFQGIVEGDPQVKVYSQVPGKFVKNNVIEGTFVKKDDIIAYIDRDMIGFKYELAPVKAPISGIVTKLYYLDKGDSISPQFPVAEIANDENIKVVINAGQDDIIKIKKGQKANIFYVNDPAILMEGEVFSVPPVVDKDIMAGTIVVKANNKGRTMKIGMSVNVEVILEEAENFVVPERAILLGEDYAFVFVNKNGKAEQVRVNTGFKYKGFVEISGPFNNGDEIVVDGNFKIYSGANIKAEYINLNF
ncbi:MAG: efflux RND transporter periplasmic adaptor subunit [Candidatus Goldbacteria bacterium]|nr:efflux RND transporter periplasmic adaptor subunit [Candidatus Goldiibacteriota bacterium]